MTPSPHPAPPTGASPAWPPHLALSGPTAAGKTAAALAIAARWPVEIISVDSALVYRGLDIGAAKPSAAERAAVVHHLIDIRNPDQPYSAADFARDAGALLHAIHARGRTPLLVGGTLLYFKALWQGLADLPPADPAVRAAIAAEAAQRGWPALHAELAAHDAPSAARLAPQDAQRIARAIEVLRLTGRPLSHFHALHSVAANALSTGDSALFEAKFQIPPMARLISLEPQDRAWLHARIAQRWSAMLEAGLLDEVRALQAQGLSADWPALRSVGYRQAWQALSEGWPLAVLHERACAATRQLAKRQLTWLRGLPQRHVLACDAPDALARTLALAQDFFATQR